MLLKRGLPLILLMLLLSSTHSYSTLQLVDITDTKWRCYDDNGFLAWMTFTVNGTTRGIISTPTSYGFTTWNYMNRQLVLQALTTPVVTFTWGNKDHYGAWRLYGLYLPTNPSATNVRNNIYLQQII